LNELARISSLEWVVATKMTAIFLDTMDQFKAAQSRQHANCNKAYFEIGELIFLIAD